MEKTTNLEGALYKRRDVVAATGIPEATLNAWQDRGLIPDQSFAVPGTGHHRLYSAVDVARLAAILNLTVQGLAVSEASQLIRGGHILRSWPVLVTRCMERGVPGIFACVDRFKGDKPSCEIHDDPDQALSFLTESGVGERVGDSGPRDDSDRSVFNVGPAVMAAVRALS